ncbi:MAG: hypothetical protein EZS28_014650 [Streblomastix strix]|uniref:Uncharacterized protein n=1 Tax=Streblomastix strix TaxID=222440 RepID=A0A5J4W598_9EUKA|nr:MAG: hypothetical protein EZS28_014650 [Streblomastix strix]
MSEFFNQDENLTQQLKEIIKMNHLKLSNVNSQESDYENEDLDAIDRLLDDIDNAGRIEHKMKIRKQRKSGSVNPPSEYRSPNILLDISQQQSNITTTSSLLTNPSDIPGEVSQINQQQGRFVSPQSSPKIRQSSPRQHSQLRHQSPSDTIRTNRPHGFISPQINVSLSPIPKQTQQQLNSNIPPYQIQSQSNEQHQVQVLQLTQFDQSPDLPPYSQEQQIQPSIIPPPPPEYSSSSMTNNNSFIGKLSKEQKQILIQIYLLREIFAFVLKIESQYVIFQQSHHNVSKSDRKTIQNNINLLHDFYQLLYPDELYIFWLNDIGESGMKKNIQMNYIKEQKLFKKKLKNKISKILKCDENKDKDKLSKFLQIVRSTPHKVTHFLREQYQSMRKFIQLAMLRILKFDLSVADIWTNNNNSVQTDEDQLYDNSDNDDEEDGDLYYSEDANTLEASNYQNRRNKHKQHPLTHSLRNKQRVFRLIEQTEEEFDTSFVTFNLIWKSNRNWENNEIIQRQNRQQIMKIKQLQQKIKQQEQQQQEKQKEKEKQKEQEQDLEEGQILESEIEQEQSEQQSEQLNEYQYPNNGGGMWSKRWGKFPFNEQNDQQNQTKDFSEKKLRYFMKKCVPELSDIQQQFDGLYEFGTRRIECEQNLNQSQSSQSSSSSKQQNNLNQSQLFPFPQVLYSFQTNHAPIVPCNHKCGIIGTVNAWKRTFIVHSHTNHSRVFNT